MTRRPRSGFTLAEVAMTIVIMGIGLLLVLQGLNTAKMTAAHTRNYKLSRELALLTIGQIESGLFQEDIDRGLTGSYADEGYPDFTFEVVVGDETFREPDDDGTFDSWAPTDDEERAERDEEEEVAEPFEKVKVRITCPKIQDFSNELVLERWIPWTQVYGESEEDAKPGASAGSSTAAAGADGASAGAGGK